MLLKALGARFGGGGTTAAGAAVVSAISRGLHLEPAIADGSGLSRDDRTTPLDVVTLLRDLSPGGIAVPPGDRRGAPGRPCRSPPGAAR